MNKWEKSFNQFEMRVISECVHNFSKGADPNLNSRIIAKLVKEIKERDKHIKLIESGVTVT